MTSGDKIFVACALTQEFHEKFPTLKLFGYMVAHPYRCVLVWGQPVETSKYPRTSPARSSLSRLQRWPSSRATSGDWSRSVGRIFPVWAGPGRGRQRDWWMLTSPHPQGGLCLQCTMYNSIQSVPVPVYKMIVYIHKTESVSAPCWVASSPGSSQLFNVIQHWKAGRNLGIRLMLGMHVMIRDCVYMKNSQSILNRKEIGRQSYWL